MVVKGCVMHEVEGGKGKKGDRRGSGRGEGGSGRGEGGEVERGRGEK